MLAERIAKLVNHLSVDLFGGPRPWLFATVVNLQKGTMLPFLLALAWWTGNRSTAAWTYLALHGGEVELALAEKARRLLRITGPLSQLLAT